MSPPAPPTPPSRGHGRLDPARERDDLLTLALAAALVPLGWLLLGWRWPLCVSGYDAWATALPLLDRLAEAKGEWTALAYRPDLLGGTRLRDAVGPNPLAALLARAGLQATGIYDLSAFTLQALVGFFGARAAEDLCRAWTGAAPPWSGRVGSILLCAFAPALGWRLGYGHLAMTTGLLPFSAALALVAAAGVGRTSATLFATAMLATAQGLLFTGHQLVLYGVVFGAPLLAGIALSARLRLGQLAPAALALGLGLLLALPGLSGVVDHVLTGDAPRGPTGLRITYSYLTAEPLDWLTSIPWTRAAVPGRRPPLHHHESNVPIGPLLAALALVPWRRARPLAWALGATAALVLVFSMDVRPASSLLVAAVPPLGSFRVPTRAALPLVLALSSVAAAAVVGAAAGQRARSREWLPGLAGFALLAAGPPLPREALAWTVVVALAWAQWKRPGPRPVAAAAALLAVSGAALGAFGERLLRPFRDTEAVLGEARAIGAAAVSRDPGLREPLARIVLETELPELGANTAFAAGLSSLDGYFFPSRRLVALACALRRQPYDPSAFVLRFRADEPAGRVLFVLYDVRWSLRNEVAVASEAAVPKAIPPPRGGAAWRVAMQPLTGAAGPAWFSDGVESVPDIAAVAERLRDAPGALAPRLRRVVWVAAADPAAAELPTPGSCAAAAVTSVLASRAGAIAVGVAGSDGCPLTIAANYAASLRARARIEGRWQEARAFPAYGALLGVWVPRGATEVAVDAR